MISSKFWITRSLAILKQSLSPVGTEPNELDWKSGMSPNKERLIAHLSAFANHTGGGFLVFGIDNSTGSVTGVAQKDVEPIVGQLTNLGREALEPPIVIDHTVADWEGTPILVVYIPEQQVKPVHRRGKSIRAHRSLLPACRVQISLQQRNDQHQSARAAEDARKTAHPGIQPDQ